MPDQVIKIKNNAETIFIELIVGHGHLGHAILELHDPNNQFMRFIKYGDIAAGGTEKNPITDYMASELENHIINWDIAIHFLEKNPSQLWSLKIVFYQGDENIGEFHYPDKSNDDDKDKDEGEEDKSNDKPVKDSCELVFE